MSTWQNLAISLATLYYLQCWISPLSAVKCTCVSTLLTVYSTDYSRFLQECMYNAYTTNYAQPTTYQGEDRERGECCLLERPSSGYAHTPSKTRSISPTRWWGCRVRFHRRGRGGTGWMVSWRCLKVYVITSTAGDGGLWATSSYCTELLQLKHLSGGVKFELWGHTTAMSGRGLEHRGLSLLLAMSTIGRSRSGIVASLDTMSCWSRDTARSCKFSPFSTVGDW